MRKEIKSFGVVQSSKVTAVLGFVITAIYALPFAIYLLFTGEDKSVAVTFFMLPLFYLVLCFVIYLAVFFLYNKVAKIVGGIEVEVVDKE